jgi:hypothetical protein
MENLVKLKLDRLEEISLPSPAWRKKRSSPLSLNWFFEEEVGAKERKKGCMAMRMAGLPSANTVEDHGRIVVDEGGYL